MDDESEPEGSLIRSIVAKDIAASSLAKGPASKESPKTAYRRRGQLSVEVSGTSARTKSFKRLARHPGHRYPKPTAWRTGLQLTRSFFPPGGSFSTRRDQSGLEGEGNYPLRGHGAAPTSPPGGVLRFSSPLRC